MKYIYFVSYWYADDDNQMGFGNVEFTSDAPITTHQETREIGRILENRQPWESLHVVILNFILLRTETEEEYLIRNA